MPLIPFTNLPAESRIWIFGCDPALTGDDALRLLDEVDRYLGQWKAHGVPLVVARDWAEDRFLTIGVDTTQEIASGCSIDGLFRTLQTLERSLGTRLLAGGRVFYRDASGSVRATSRDDFTALAEDGRVNADTTVFDTSLTTAADRRTRFETKVGDSWAASLLPSPR